MRCGAVVPEKSLDKRSRWSGQEPQCKRQAVTWLNGPRCEQHSRVPGFCNRMNGRKCWYSKRGDVWRCSCCHEQVRNVIW